MKKVPKLRFKEFTGEWEEKRLGEILKEYYLGSNYINSEKFSKYPLIKMGNLDRGKMNLKKVEYIEKNEKVLEKDKLKYGTLLFNTRNTPELVGKVAIWRNELSEAYFNSNLMKMEFDNNFFMNYKFNTQVMIEKLKGIATGTTSVGAIYTKDLLKLFLDIPSLQEQEKIANFLSSVDKKISLIEEKLELFKSYKKGIMQKIFSQKLRFKDENGNDYPKWEEKKLEDIGKFFRGHSYNASNVVDNGLLVLRSNNIQNNKINYDDLQFVNKNCKEEIFLEDKDIVICMANGSKKLVGKTGEYKKNKNYNKVTVGAFCSIFRTTNIIGKYLFQTEKYYTEISLMLEGTNINNLKNSSLENIYFYIPYSLKEQEKIANFLSSIDEKIEKIENELENLKEFKKGLLQQMFI